MTAAIRNSIKGTISANAISEGSSEPEEILSLPRGLRRLMRIGQVFSAGLRHDMPYLRIIVTVPTIRLAGMAVALGASVAKPHCDADCVHTQLDHKKRMAACYWDRHLQDREAWVDTNGVHVGTSTFTKDNGSVHRLPDGFPIDRNRVPRNSNSRFEEEIRDLAMAKNETPAKAGLIRSREGAHPVLCIGNFADIETDLDLARTIPGLANLHPLGRLAPGEHYESWFRHPLLVTKKAPRFDQRIWLSDVRPRLVLRLGQNALLTPMQGLWPEVPHVILLSRRASSSVSAIESVVTMGWKAIYPVADSLERTLRPGDGLEIGSFLEPGNQRYDSVNDTGDYEW